MRIPPLQLPKQFWRVVVSNTPEVKLGIYETGSKTYAHRGHAVLAAKKRKEKGFDVRLLTTAVWWEEIPEEEW